MSKIYFLSYDVAPSPTVGTNDYWGVTAVLYDARQQRVGGSAVRVRAQAKLIYALGDVAYTGAYEYEAGGGSADAAEPASAAFPWHELSFDESSFSILAAPADASTDPFRLSFHPAGGDPWPDAGNLYVVLLQEALGELRHLDQQRQSSGLGSSRQKP